MNPSIPDAKIVLRKFDFPQSASEALLKLEQLCLPLAHTRPPTSKQLDYIGEIIDEFVFCEGDRKISRKKKLTAIQELALLQVLNDFFIQPNKEEVVLNTVFMMLFTPPHNPSPAPSPAPNGVSNSGSSSTTANSINNLSDRMRILAKLVSMALAMDSRPILNCTGVWMQQLGCLSEHSVNLARVLVEDYFVLLSPAIATPALANLPIKAPHFTACFLSATAEIYGGVTGGKFSLPPQSLIETITQWIATNPRLCLTPLTLNLQPLLPKGSIVMTSVTPLAGLLRWCIETPVAPYVPQAHKLIKFSPFNDSEPETPTSPSKNPASGNPLSHLHLGLLETMLEKLTLAKSLLPGDVLSPRHVTSIVKAFIEDLRVLRSCPEDSLAPDDVIQLCLDRLGQAIQVSQATGCLYGNLHELTALIKTLPYNRLLEIVVRKNM